jgi:hypothetical protein
MPLADMAQYFASSGEFAQLTGGLTNAQFVTYCYENVLGRAPDPPGYNEWLRLLNEGWLNRGQVMLGFSESPEYIDGTVSNVRVSMLYQSLLRRTSDTIGYNFHVELLESGTLYSTLVAGFFYSPEYRLRFLPN